MQIVNEMDTKEDALFSTQRIVELLMKYRWVFNFQVTRFFIEKPWKDIPEQVQQVYNL